MSTIRDIERQPLTARSAIASMLLGMRPPRLSGQLLVRSNELFGINEGTTRTALSRMVRAGELVADGGTYELAGNLRARQERQAQSRRARRLPWDGTWVLGVVEADRRSAPERSELREAMRRLRMAEWREGLWCRPDNLDPWRLPEDRAVLDAQCSTVRGARPDEPPLGRFGLAGWAASARELIGAMEGLLPRLEAGDRAALRDGFLLSADVIRHFGADPLLPLELLPAGWPGEQLRRVFDRYDRAFTGTHRSWFRP